MYKNGILQPLGTVPLEEMQEVTVTITDSCPVEDDLAGYFSPEEWAEAAHESITWEEVREVLSKVSGSLSDVVIAHRQER